MPLCWRSGFHVGNPVLELLPEYILHARKQIRNNVSLCRSLPSMCCSWHVKQARKGHQIACSVLMTPLGTLAANPKFWAPISNPLHSWGLKNAGTFDHLKPWFITGDAKPPSKSVSPQIQKRISNHLHVIMQKVWWGGGVGVHSFSPQNSKLLGHAWRRLGALVWLLLVFSFPSSRCKLFRWQHQRSERSRGKNLKQMLYIPRDHLSKELCLPCGYGVVFSRKTSL